MKKLYFTILVTFILLSSCKGKLNTKNSKAISIIGQIDNYNGEIAKLNIMGFLVAPQFHGNINKKGNIELHLPEGFMSMTTTAFSTYNSSPESVYELSPIGIEDIFSPLEDLKITGNQEQLALAGRFYGFETYEEDVKTGLLFPASSMEFMQHLMNPDKYNLTQGHHYMFIYSSGDNSIIGMNETPIELNNKGEVSLVTKTIYDVQLSNGWNIVKYQINSISIDNSNVPYIEEASFKSIKTDIEDIEWIFSPS